MKKTFETAMTRLNEISILMNSDDLPLENALKLYSEASGLMEICKNELDSAQLSLKDVFEGRN
ncbi:MAG: exodeoxyribonuclease VII small subunit [Eubacterium sp.]|jgi:exodeoxyribonuclease VII small subunit|nr:exodeoxyribonuclease VII small subunit [Eubacterium sp.]